jgi:hypothetical protein
MRIASAGRALLRGSVSMMTSVLGSDMRGEI